MLNAGATNETSVTLVPLPARPGLKAIEPGVFDAVSTLSSPWTGQTQRQAWPGNERWTAKCTLPPLHGDDIDDWEGWMLGMSGMLNAVQLGFPNKLGPRGLADSQSKPVVDATGSGSNPFGARTLVTRGWKPNAKRLLLRNDAFQVGYRYYRALDTVNADANGAATIGIWPSLRETPADGTPLLLKQPKVLFALATNARTWGLRLPMVMDLSFDLVEYR